ncbi:DNA circularization protein [Collimonas antrihumi]|uniref:DNA circularization protein n=1 Tax=Collimonas antrihumi TaxID=1940615 RepID=UPI001B8CA41A|nr:DNA circularization N-terminal domain-containing protein [Collimonas antrihumi]
MDIEWLKQLRQASWRGVPFQVDTVDTTAGQNTVLRDYPFQDLPTVFSMGATAEEFKFSAYVIGDDYLQQLDALREVLQGDGILIHPTQGSIRCYYHGKYTVKEAPASEGGIARLELNFVRGEERRYPTGTQNTTEALEEANAEAKKSVIDTFTDQFKIDGLPGWSLDNLRNGLRGALDAAWSVISTVNSGVNYYDNLVQQFIISPSNELLGISGVLGNTVGSIMRVPQNLPTSQATAIFGQMRNLWPISSSQSVANAYKTSGVPPVTDANVQLARALTPPYTPYATEARQREAELFTRLAVLFEGLATVAAAEAVAQIELDNIDQAAALRQDFNQQLSRLLRLSVADHGVLMRLHTAVLADLQERSKGLARITNYTPQSWQPALYISYRLFGTVQWMDEILRMNPHIRHPLLVPPNTPLRVIKHNQDN